MFKRAITLVGALGLSTSLLGGLAEGASQTQRQQQQATQRLQQVQKIRGRQYQARVNQRSVQRQSNSSPLTSAAHLKAVARRTATLNRWTLEGKPERGETNFLAAFAELLPVAGIK